MLNYRLIMSFQFYIIYFLLKNLRLNFKISFRIPKCLKNFIFKLGYFFKFLGCKLFKKLKNLG
jgi:hypothetical protein